MIYSTLKEVYNVDSFEKDKKSKSKKKKYEYEEDVEEDFSTEVKTKTPAASPAYVSQSSQTHPSATSPMNALAPAPSSALSKEVQRSPNPSVSSVQPYYDEELEQYLYEPQRKPADFLQRPQPSPLQAQETQLVPANRQQNAQLASIQHASIPATVPTIYNHTNAKDTYYKNLVNIGLFIFIGILIIFLCDQITEIAINLGMKKTIELLEPFLSKEKNKL